MFMRRHPIWDEHAWLQLSQANADVYSSK